jgi:hypothetical protein
VGVDSSEDERGNENPTTGWCFSADFTLGEIPEPVQRDLPGRASRQQDEFAAAMNVRIHPRACFFAGL